MEHPFYKNKWYIAIALSVCLLAGLLNVLVMSPLVHIPTAWLWLDGTINALILAAASVPLWMIIKFVDFTKAGILQRWLNSFALCVLTLSVCMGLDMLVNYLSMPAAVYNSLLPAYPIRIIIGIMLYVMLVQHFLVLTEKHKMEEKEEEQDSIAEIFSESEEPTTQMELIDRIAVKLGQKIHVIAIPDILFLQAEGDYVMIHTKEGKFLKEQTMKYFEQHLPNNKFVRVHRSCIVNVEIISRVELYEKQNYLLYLQNGQKIKASINGYKLLKRTLSL